MVWSTFFHVCPFEKKGGGGQAIWAMPVWKQHISKRGFPYRNDKKMSFLGQKNIDMA